LTLTDRLAVKLYSTNSGGKTTTIHTQDGHLCQIITTFSTGITALNGLTAQVQYFQVGTSGTDFNISSTTATHTFNLPTASAANRGALSSADWSTFNGKQNTLTLTTTGTSGASTLVGATLNIPQYQAAGTYVTSVTGTSPIVSSGGTTPAISIPAATSSVDGYLSSTDWNTFNGKIGGGGTTNYIPKFSGTFSIADSIIYDNSGKVLINTTDASIGHRLAVYSATEAAQLRVMGLAPSVLFTESTTNTNTYSAYLGVVTSTNNFYTGSIVGDFVMSNNSNYGIAFAVNNSQKLRIANTGAATFASSVTATSFVKTGGTSAQFLKADGSVDSSTYLTTSAAASTYQTILTNPVTGTGTTNYLPKFTGASTIGNSLISDDGTNIQASRSAGDLEFGIISGSSSVAGNSSIALYSNTGSGSLLPYGTIKVSPDAAGNTRAAKMVFGVRQSGGALLDALTIASTGIATFSSSVFAASYYGQTLTTSSQAAINLNNTLDNQICLAGNARMTVVDYTTTKYLFTITPTGNVGIGTSSPLTKLDLFGGTGAGSVGMMLDGSSSPSLQLYSLTNEAGIGTNSFTSKPLTFKVNMTYGVVNSGTEAMCITSGGYLKASNNGTYENISGSYHELRNTSSDTVVRCTATNGSYTSTVVAASADRAATSAYSLYGGWSGNFGDKEFDLKGDGNAYADGSWTGGGADYAEYFEWLDGNIKNEDRRGYSVSLVGNKIKIAEQGENIIGVISGNPSIVGDAAWNKWSGKHLKDDFGSYILDEDGNRTLNPDYDENAEYIPREQRPEWGVVGLMGKLRLRKDQLTMSSWIKMRDISNTVEEWLVK
jgi:hypothetical protein